MSVLVPGVFFRREAPLQARCLKSDGLSWPAHVLETGLECCRLKISTSGFHGRR
jgi:hypothetical protein